MSVRSRHAVLFMTTFIGFTSIAGSGAFAQNSAPKGYAELLAKYVSASPDGVNRVAYGKWKVTQPDCDKLGEVINAMVAQKPSAMPRNDAFAYWANLYNAVTLKVILDAYPVKSIRDIKSTGTSLLDFKSFTGPWRTKRVVVEGNELSLDDIENSVLRPLFKDPRGHYSINCASVGCPNLRQKPWIGQTLDADLDDAARTYINNPRGVSVGRDGAVTVSSIYSWFDDDFGGNKAGVLAHLRKYASADLAAKLKDKTTFNHSYDWALNEAGTTM
jgi:Protein of unknown function, DUF547